jgi:threonine dehydrogenase-like Zn-dependent dehydrogenase
MSIVSGLAFPGHRVVELREFPIAEPGPTEVRIAVKASGICGSDLHTYDSERGLRAPGADTLLVAGHEPAGVVESVGAEVVDFVVGDRVLAYHIMGCGNCYNCRLGYPVVCTSSTRAAYGGERDGGHSPLLLVEQRSLIQLPVELSFIDGAMIACGVGTAYSAIRKTGIRAGNRLLVTGLGPVGLAVTLLAHDMGVEVIGADLNPTRSAEAIHHGLSHALTNATGSDAAEEITELTGGTGVDAAIDCTGAASARSLCLEASGVWGQVIFVGVSREKLTFDPTMQVIVKMLTVRGSWVSSQAEMQELTSILSRRGVHPESLVTQKFSLEEGSAAYETFRGGASGKMVFTFD